MAKRSAVRSTCFMTEKPTQTEPMPNLSRRLKLSSREIGVAVALTCAAAVQLVSAFSSRDSAARSGNATGAPVALIERPR
jgi:hypothetical protein